MSMNRIQFQPGLSLRDFQKRYCTDEQCERAVFAARWPQGWHCARCGCTRSFMTRNGRGTFNKSAFVAAVQTSADGQPRCMRLTPVDGFTNEII